MSDGELLLQQILASPEDDTVRLVYADWLQEHGETERAEFIRVQCELAALPRCNDEGGIYCDRCQLLTSKWGRYSKRCRGRVCRLRHREYYSSRRFVAWTWCEGIPAGAHKNYCRGFVWHIELTCDNFMQHAGAIFSRHPVTSVRLTDKEPEYASQYFWFYDTSRDMNPDRWEVIPLTLFTAGRSSFPSSGCQRFDTVSDGHRWLSDACVSFGREAARKLAPPVSEARD